MAEVDGAVAATAVKGEVDVKPATDVPAAVTDLESECKKQIEFYFSDANLPFDKFLFTLSHKDPQGWVPIATLASFKRMRLFKESLGLEKIAELMRTSTEVDVNPEGDKVKRSRELVRQTDAFDRSVYVKGFPEETETLQQEIEKFFNQFGNINSVRMRRAHAANTSSSSSTTDRKPAFKGSVFVEFADLPEMQAFLEKGKEEGQLKYGETPLKVMSKDAYCQMKMAEKGIDPSTVQRGGGGAANGGEKKSFGKKFNAFKELDRHARGLPSVLGEGDAAQERRSKKEETEERRRKAKEDRGKSLEFEFMETKLTTLPDGTVDVEQLRFPERSVLAFKEAGAGGNWKDLKDTLATLHPTSFVEFPAGAVEGAVGFKASVDDDKLKEIVDKAITVGGQPVVWSRVDEERAKKFYLDRANFRAAYLIDQRELREAEGSSGSNGRSGGFHDRRSGSHRGGRGGRGGGRGGRGGRGGGHGHRGGRDGGDNKRKRTDDNSGSRSDNPAPPEIASSKKTKTEGSA